MVGTRADGPDRVVRPAGHLHRVRWSGRWRRHGPAGHLSALQPDVPQGGAPQDLLDLDDGRAIDSVPAARSSGDARRIDVSCPPRPDQQLVHLPGCWPRRACGGRTSRERLHVRDCRARTPRRALAGQARTPAPICCRRSPTFATVSVAVAQAVARAARDDGLCAPLDDAGITRSIAAKMWEPQYRPYRLRRRV